MTKPDLRSAAGYDLTPPSAADRAALAERLTPEERQVLLAQGTERAFCGGLLDNEVPGVYACRLCGLPLFRSSTKFESNTGWPSFYAPLDAAHVATRSDTSYGISRVEILCARCAGHLGHVFDDGPAPTGQRYCLNSAALEFFADGVPVPQKTA